MIGQFVAFMWLKCNRKQIGAAQSNSTLHKDFRKKRWEKEGNCYENRRTPSAIQDKGKNRKQSLRWATEK